MTTFFREEVYRPLGGRHRRKLGYILVFTYSGFWHFPSVSAVLVFPLIHFVLMEATWKWREFWQYHKRQDDWIHHAGLRYKLHDSWLSDAVGMVFTFHVMMITLILHNDHFFGGTKVLPILFGF